MDPAAVLPTHLFESILSYFKIKEIKNLISVNKLWYQVITSSCKWDKGSVLALRNDWICDEQDVNSFIEFGKKRNFHSLLLSDCTEMYDVVLDVMKFKRKCCLTSVSVFDMKFESDETFSKFIKSFETTVKDLTFDRVEIKTGDPRKCDLDFNMANLQNLKVSHCSPKIYMSFLQNSPKLKSLNCDFGIEFNRGLRNVLKSSKNLKKLSLNTQLLSTLVDKNFAEEVKFQLKEFYVSNSDFVEISSEMLENIEKFLETQMALEKIYFSDWLSFDILNCVLNMKNLKEFSLFTLPLGTWGFVNFPSNISIEIFDIKTFKYDDNNDDIKNLLTAVPNVQHLKLRSLNDEMVNFISQNLKKLTTISLVHPTVKRDILSHVKFD